MIHRKDEEGIIVISQPAHAWVTGQLTRDWGNAVFGEFKPHEEVNLAATLHDIGFLDWEMAPTLNPRTKLPYSFMEMPTSEHLEIWKKSVKQVLMYNRYAALLVSMHFTWLCESQPSKAKEDQLLEKKFRDEQEELQTSIITSLENDFYYEALTGDETIIRNRELVSIWDWMSLLLCMGFEEERVIENVPTAHGVTHIQLKPEKDHRTRISVEPWPFGREAVQVRCEGKHLIKSQYKEQELRDALQAASPVTLVFDLVRA
jgi:Protein of unknown function (DUF3891)